MLANAPKILLSYAGLLFVLGVALAAADGFHSGWRIVGMNVAIGCTIAAVLCHLGSAGHFAMARRAGRVLGITLTFAAAINFARLAFKWHGSELEVPLDATIAALMSVTGFCATVLLWRTMRDDIAANWAEHIRKLAAVTGMAAMVGGLAMLKFASTPQAATAFTQSTAQAEQLVNDAADGALGERVIDAALNNQSVLDALEQRGITTEQARGLAEQPELRAAAFDILQGRDVELDTRASAASNASSDGPAAPVAPDAADTQRPDSERDRPAQQHIIPLENIDLSAINTLDPAQIEQHLADPRIGAALLQIDAQPANISREANAAPSHAIAPHADAGSSLPATRNAPERLAGRTAGARLNRRAATDPRLTNLDDQPDSIADGSRTADAAPAEIDPAGLFAQRSLLDRADPAQQRFMLGSAEPALDLLRSEPGAPDAPAGSPIADGAASSTVADARVLAETIRSELIETTHHAPLPRGRSWLLDPGLFLTRTGTIALAVGAAVVLCAIAAGQRRSPAPAT